MEIQAFAEAYKTDVKVYDFDKVIVISAPGIKDVKSAVHIAYHVSVCGIALKMSRPT